MKQGCSVFRDRVRGGGRLFLLGALAAVPSALFALNPAVPLREYIHTAWTGSEGVLVPPVYAVTVGPDGYLWLGTAQGAVRFDGIRFTPWRPPGGGKLPSQEIHQLVPFGRAGIWIGSTVAFSRLEDGNFQNFAAVDRDPGGIIIRALPEASGGVWALLERDTRTWLALLARDGRPRVFGPSDGLPAASIQSITDTGDGRLWLATSDGICRWSPGTVAVCRKISASAAIGVARAAGGGLVVADQGGSIWCQTKDGGAWTSHHLSDARVWPGRILADRQGNVWVGTSAGVLRLHAGRMDRFTRSDGLSGTTIHALAEDPEGDLWVATEGGIDRFQDPRVRHVSSLDGLSSDVVTALAAARDGALWAGTAANGLNRISGHTIQVFAKTQGLPGLTVSSLFEDVRARLWAATDKGLVYFDGARFVPAKLPDGGGRTYGLGGDRSGAIWLPDERLGLVRLHDGAAPAVMPPPLPQLMRATVASDGAVWLGSHAGRLAALRAGAMTEYPPYPGPVRAIYQDRAGAIWIGAGNVLSRYRNRRWTNWGPREGLDDSAIQGIVEDDRSGLWVVTSLAAFRLRKSDLDLIPDGSPRRLEAKTYGMPDGLRLDPRLGSTGPRIAKTADGRIWICERASLGIIDPGALREDSVPPPVAIEQLVLDGNPLEIRGAPAFRGRELHIAYTGVSLLAPERVRFRYRLQPLNNQWIDAGTRRDVTYADLPPRHYRFQVAACNLDGVCNQTGAALDFRVEPFFYQTYWFLAGCVGLAGLAMWGAYRVRLRALTARFQLVAQERARMTREIHDSLLQGFAGVVYQLDAAARQFDTAPDQSRKKLDRALDLADQALREAREVLSTMRLTPLEDRALPEALERTCERLAEAAGASFALKVKGRVEPLRYEMQAAMFLIGREAVTNAANHARASRITMLLAYSGKALRLAVQDDGAGFDPAAAMERNGHWGLRGMRERAQQIGARFRLDTAPGKGTRVEVEVDRK